MKRVISLSFVVFLIFASDRIMAQEVLQTNIQPLNNSLRIISKLKPISFNYDKAWAEKLKLTKDPYFGFAGSELTKSFPELINVQSKSYLAGKNSFNNATITTVDYEKLIPLLVGSIQEQQKQIEDLTREIQTLKSTQAK